MMAAAICLTAWADGRVARVTKGNFMYSNWDAPCVTLDSCLDRSINEVRIPDSIMHNGRSYPVVEIGNNAFKGCRNLTTVILHEKVSGILLGAFHDCPRLKVVVCKSTIPFNLEGNHPFYGGTFNDIFESYHALTTVLVVPPGSEQTYRDAPGWGCFNTIQSTMPTSDQVVTDEISARINELESQLTRARQQVQRLEQELKALRESIKVEN